MKKELKKNRKYVVEIDIQKLTFDFDDNLSAEHIKDLELALSQIPRVVEFLQISLSSGEKEVWTELRQAGWGWIPPHNWDDLDDWEYGLCWHFLGDYVGVTVQSEEEVLLSLLSEKGFEKSGEGYYTYLLTNNELQEYFSLDSDRTELIESGQIKAALLEVYPEEKKVNYILFEETPSEQDIALANVIHEDDFEGFMEWLQG